MYACACVLRSFCELQSLTEHTLRFSAFFASSTSPHTQPDRRGGVQTRPQSLCTRREKRSPSAGRRTGVQSRGASSKPLIRINIKGATRRTVKSFEARCVVKITGHPLSNRKTSVFLPFLFSSLSPCALFPRALLPGFVRGIFRLFFIAQLSLSRVVERQFSARPEVGGRGEVRKSSEEDDGAEASARRGRVIWLLEHRVPLRPSR